MTDDLGEIRVIHGDCLEIVPTLGIVDSIVCDPPYDIGFMSRAWDKCGVAFCPENWSKVHSALKPGGYLLAFGGTRTYHRMVCAIEDSGLVIQDCLMWIYGSGFPKGKYMLKPAWEPIVMAYKPGDKRALQIDECRVDLNGDYKCGANGRPSQTGLGDFYDPAKANKHSDIGRWPANLCHDGSDEVLELFPRGRSAGTPASNGPKGTGKGVTYAAIKPQGQIYSDDGSAARFFYCPKANKHDRAESKHPTVKPVALMQWLVQLVTPPSGTVLDPFAGSGTTGEAAFRSGRNAILIEREAEYIHDINNRIAALSAPPSAPACYLVP